MIKLAHRTHILIYGFLWLTVGLVLLPMGLNFIVSSLLIENRAKAQPVLDFLAPMTGDRESAALVWIALMLAIGFLKARRIFAKSVQRSVLRLSSLPNPAPLSKLYPLSYYLLIGAMIFLGFLLRFVPLDIRGGIDVAVGSALINGAVLYFKQAWKTSHRFEKQQ